jgi:hypothetical protein
MNDYTERLEQLAADSTTALDTGLINQEYRNADIPSLTTEELNDFSNESSFKELLKVEKALLDQWEPIAGFNNYEGVSRDSIIKYMRRCGAVDVAPPDAERVPVGRSMRTLTVDFKHYIIEVPIAFHFIKNSSGAGTLPKLADKINRQISLLNSVYNKFNIRFRLFSIDSTINNIWFTRGYGDPNALDQMTRTLSRSPTTVMNVYTLQSSVLGVATYPWNSTRGTAMDYVIINYNSLPDGPASFGQGLYTEGKTLVHEAGHYLGLFHTFEGGYLKCQVAPPHDGCNRGDEVDDTPSQLICYLVGCDENSDSCPAPGKDPVKNYMGYNPDACITELTTGQGERLIQSILRFRDVLVTNPDWK